MQRKILTLFLALLILTGTACESSGKVPQNTDSTAPYSSPRDSAGSEKPNLDGYTLRAATYDDGARFFFSDEQNGDVVNDAVCKAVESVRDDYNINVETFSYGVNTMDVGDFVTKSVQSGDDSFDIVNGHDCTLWQLSLEGSFYDVRKLGDLDFSASWLPKYANDTYEVNGKQYVFSSYMSYLSLAYARVLFLNKTLAEEYKLELPYESVRNGTWTLDRFLGMTKDIWRDLDSDGKKSDGDLYGFVGYSKLNGWQGAYSSCYTEKNGVLSLDYDREKFISAIEKMKNLLYDSEGGYVTGVNSEIKYFLEGRSLLFFDRLLILTNDDTRQSDVNYGILPLPKYDESQDGYITPTFDCQFAIPATVSDTDKLGIVINALSRAGYEITRTEFFETALSKKYTRDEDSVEMLGIIGDTLTVDLAYLNTEAGFKGLGRAFMYCFTNPSAGIASYLESIEPAEKATIEKLNEFFAN